MSLGGKPIIMLTITSNDKAKWSIPLNKWKYIFISSRVHSGETVGSIKLMGVLNLLLGESKEAIYLRSRCIFKIVPMMNPDGVIFGNFRTNLAGVDLNRWW